MPESCVQGVSIHGLMSSIYVVCPGCKYIWINEFNLRGGRRYISSVQVVGIYQVTPVFTSFTAKVIHTEAATRGLLYKKVFLQIPQKSRENTCARVSFLIKLQVLKVFSKLKMFSCEFCEIPNNTFFTEQRWTTASITSS